MKKKNLITKTKLYISDIYIYIYMETVCACVYVIYGNCCACVYVIYGNCLCLCLCYIGKLFVLVLMLIMHNS